MAGWRGVLTARPVVSPWLASWSTGPATTERSIGSFGGCRCKNLDPWCLFFFLNWGIWNAGIIIEVGWGPMSVIRCFLHPYLWWLKKLLKSVNIQCINTQQAVLLFFCFCAGAHAERQPPGGGVVGQKGSQAHHSYQEERGDSREVSRAPTTPQNVRLSTFVVPFIILFTSVVGPNTLNLDPDPDPRYTKSCERIL